MAYTNLPGTFESRLDGNLVIADSATDPIYMVLGTASQGVSESIYSVRRLNDAARVFAKTGTLIRGMYEAAQQGAKNIKLFRIGATAAKLEDVGGGITIETLSKDDSAGTDYDIFYEHSSGRLRVWNVSTSVLVYDNNPSYPLQAIDLGEVTVSGAKAAGGTWTDIGTGTTTAGRVTLEDADGEGGDTGAVYTAGTDGTDLSRMELYEALHRAYKLLEDQTLDVCIPMNVYLDDQNVMDMTPANAVLNQPAANAYPTAGTSYDTLGKVHIEEYDGEYHFWWYFPSDPTAGDEFTSDGGAQIFPDGIGSATALLGADGTTLTDADFHEVNFAYQLANFCYEMGGTTIDVTGVVGVKPPASYSPKDVSNWVGKLPVAEIDATTGNNIITTNGTGLLGNKFMAGRLTDAVNEINGWAIDGVDGLYGGGFIATDTGFCDGTQLKDENDSLIDIGAYISITASYASLSNSSRTSAYVANIAAAYGGFYVGLPANSAPTNKLFRGVQLPYRVSTSKIDLLAGVGYVTLHSKAKGIVISDAPTAARAESDYRRLTTVRIVKAVIDSIRAGADPFLGEGMSDLQMQALDTRIDESCQQKVKDQYLNRYEKSLTASPEQKVLGQAVLELTLIPVFELRKIFIVVALAAI